MKKHLQLKKLLLLLKLLLQLKRLLQLLKKLPLLLKKQLLQLLKKRLLKLLLSNQVQHAAQWTAYSANEKAGVDAGFFIFHRSRFPRCIFYLSMRQSNPSAWSAMPIHSSSQFST